MSDNHQHLEGLFDPEKLTDIEVALHFWRLMDTPCPSKGVQDYLEEKNYIRILAENALKNMTNPYARKLLEGKMTEH